MRQHQHGIHSQPSLLGLNSNPTRGYIGLSAVNKVGGKHVRLHAAKPREGRIMRTYFVHIPRVQMFMYFPADHASERYSSSALK